MNKEFTERIDALTADQKELLQLLRNKKEQQSGIRHPGTVADGHASVPESPAKTLRKRADFVQKKLSFSLFFFSDDGANTKDHKYQLLLECAAFADQNGFDAVWIPERHFMPFGGLYPNPSVIAAALAMITERTQLRAGSVVLPLQNPIRVAEEWSVVDNLSNGRVAIAFASGWHPDDFVLAPDRFENRRDRMFEEIETVQNLWHGKTLTLRNGVGKDVAVRTFPNPIQSELPIWITATSPETFKRAGAIGANVITGLMEQGIDQCAENIRAYRDSLKSHGYQASDGRVAVMLHTFLGPDLAQVKEQTRAPFSHYLRSFIGMIEKNFVNNSDAEVDVTEVTANDREALLNYAFERYFKTSALLGTPETCRVMVENLRAADVDEIACLLDFGLDAPAILEGLTYLRALKDQCAEESIAANSAL